MKTLAFFFILITHLIPNTKYSYSQTFQWVKQEGTIESRDNARKTIFDQSGDMYVIGTFGGLTGGTTLIGNISVTSHGQGDVFIAKYDGSRDLLWVRTGGSIYYDYIYGLEVDLAGNVYAGGIFSKSITGNTAPMFFGSTALQTFGKADLFIVKFNSNGELITAKSFGSTEDDQLNGMSKDASGNIYINGGFKNSITFGSNTLTSSNGSYQHYITKFNSEGNILWAKNSSGTTNCIGVDIVSDETGNTISTGFFSGSTTFGNTTLNSHGSNDILLVKHNQTGEVVWAKSFGGNELDYGLKVDTDTDGNIFLTGSFEFVLNFGSDVSLTSRGGGDVFISKFDPNGNIIWARGAGSPTINGFTGDESPSDFITDLQGNSYLTGYFAFKIIFENDTLNCESGGADVYVVKYDREGNVNLIKKVNGLEGGRVFSNTLSTNNSDELFVSGSFIGTAEFDNINLQSGGNTDDLYIAKLSSLTSAEVPSEQLPGDFRLLQNYPNPFNPMTVIRYSLFENRFVNLKVLDILGKEIKSLVNEKQNAGNYEVEWNAYELPSGIYFYRLQSGNFSDTKSMMLLK